MTEIWLLPAALIVAAVAISIPLSKCVVWIREGHYHPLGILRWLEERVNSGPQDWKQYTAGLLIFNLVLFIWGYVILAVQPLAPWNPRGLGMLAPTTIFNSVAPFMTNTNLQHYSGEVHFSNSSQVFFTMANQYFSAAVGFCALAAVIRAFRGESKVGNYFLDMWRVLIYMFLPVALLVGVLIIQQGMPMTFASVVQVSTLEPGAMETDDHGVAKKQTMVVGPVAAVIPIKQIGTNGGGFYGANSAHPFENPTGWTNFITCLGIMIFPFTLVLMFGRMLHRIRHSVVIYGVMLSMMIAMIVWAIYFELKPNPGLTAHSASIEFKIPSATAEGGVRTINIPAIAGLPLDQHLGNLESKGLRFGTVAGPTFAALTTDVTCGAVNCAHDSLNPLTGVSPMIGMLMNCIFGGKGVGMINLLLFLIVGVFIAGRMVGRSPEYLGRKIGAREVKLAVIALLIHPRMILMPTGVFAATSWGQKAEFNPGAHGFAEVTYEFSSASANNSSGFEGLGDTWGFNANPNPAHTSQAWEIGSGLVILVSRYLPIVAPLAMAAFLGMKKESPFGAGTLGDDTPTFFFLLLGTIVIIGALLFLPAATLGPLADHLGPLPFGG